MARRLLGPGPSQADHAATKGYVDAHGGTGGGPGGPAAWGSITGELADQADLAAALEGKASAIHEHHYSEISGLGTAALADVADFASATQGARADTAVQPTDLAPVATTGAYGDLSGLPALGTAAATDAAEYATAAQGARADTAVQPGELATVATTGRYDDLDGLPPIPTALTDLDTTTTGAQLDAMAAKLDGIEPGAQANVAVDWAATSGPAAILNRPTLGTAAATNATDYATAAQGARADSAVQPADLAAVATTGRYGDLSDTPDLAAVALSGAYSDLSGLPAIPAALTDLDTTITGADLDTLVDSLEGLPVGTGAIRDYIDTEISTRAPVAHSHSAGQIIGLNKAAVGLDQVDNTSDADKPISAATAAALAAKQDVLAFTPEDRANRDTPGGYPSLDNSGKIRATQLPNSVMEYQGTWDAEANTPTLTDGVGSPGDVYRIIVGATRDLGSGPIDWDTGQYAIYNGSTWERSGASEGVSSVAGRTGDVVLTKADVGLTNVDNTSDADKPLSTAAAAALATKADASEVVHRHLDEEVTGDKVFTGLLAHFQQWNMMHLVNTLPDQYSGAGFKVYSSAETMAGAAGAQFNVFITDEDATQSALEMATIDRDGQFLAALFQFDLNSHQMRLTGPLEMGSNKVTGVTAGTNPGDAVNRAQLDTKADASHTHTVGHVSGLQAALDGKAAASHTHTIANITNLQSALDGKANASHSHSDYVRGNGTITEIVGMTALEYQQLGSRSATTMYVITG